MVSFWEPRTIVTLACACGRHVTPGVRTILKWNPAAGATLALAVCATASDSASAAAAQRIAVVRPARRTARRGYQGLKNAHCSRMLTFSTIECMSSMHLRSYFS